MPKTVAFPFSSQLLSPGEGYHKAYKDYDSTKVNAS